MTWTVNLTRTASHELKRAPKSDQARIRAALLEMRDDPYFGDIKRLRGYSGKTFRRRVGNWRILFTVYDDRIIVEVEEILRRSSTTYS